MKNRKNSSHAEEPKEKVSKLSVLKPREELCTKDFVDNFQKRWEVDDKSQITICEATVFNEPFEVAVLEKFVNCPGFTKTLVEEMVHKVEWNRKQMDLFEFFQSTDISNLKNCPSIYQFYKFLENEAKPLVEKLTNMKFTNLTATCSMYTRGDYLLVHDDLLSNRRIAFVFYISPWEGVESWTDKMGGSLDIFKTDDDDLPQFPVVRKLFPKDNQFVFFKVGRKSFHQVAEVTCGDFPRITINGWFYGDEDHPENPLDKISNDHSLDIKNPLDTNLNINEIINKNYLSPGAKKEIQSQIENNSEIKLDNFFNRDYFQKILNDIQDNENLKWKIKGPAISQFYEYLDLEDLEDSCDLKKFTELFRSDEFLRLLYDYTELDIHGSKARNPRLTLELQKWYAGCYSILGDMGSEEDSLDLLYYFNENDNVGNVTYLNNSDSNGEKEKSHEDSEDESDEEDPILLTVESTTNALNLVFRLAQQIRFIKYISKNTLLENGPVYILSASFKE